MLLQITVMHTAEDNTQFTYRALRVCQAATLHITKGGTTFGKDSLVVLTQARGGSVFLENIK
jgi:hypothetical protein